MKSQRQPFLLELGLNAVFLSLALLVALFLWISAYRMHEENLALSKLQATMIDLSELLRAHHPLDQTRWTYNAKGEPDALADDYTITLSEKDGSSTLTLSDGAKVITTWKVGN